MEFSTIDVSSAGISEVQASGTSMPADWFFEALTGHSRTSAGVRVNARTALSHGPVWAAVNILAGDISRLPIEVKLERQRENGNTEIVPRPDHPADKAMNIRPNNWQTAQQWKEMMMHWALLWGNAICRIRQVGMSFEFEPLMPDRTWYEKFGTGEYIITSYDDAGKPFTVLPEDSFHVRGLSHDGFWGLSLAQVCRETLASGMSALRHGNAVFKNGALPGGVIELERPMEPPVRQKFREDWHRVHSGGNSGTVAILNPGMSWKDRMMSNEDAQYIDSLKLDVHQVARLFQIPPFKLGAMEDSSVRANLEEQRLDYKEHSLTRWGTRFEHEAAAKLLTAKETSPTGRRLTVCVNYDRLTQGTRSDRADVATQLVRARIETQNEARQSVGLNPVPGGDEFSNPAIEQGTPQEDAEQTTDREPTEGDDDALAALITAQVQQMIDRERKRLDANKNKAVKAREYYGDPLAYLEFCRPFLAPACVFARKEYVPALINHITRCQVVVASDVESFDWLADEVETIVADIMES